jgi:hypothetical protein
MNTQQIINELEGERDRLEHAIEALRGNTLRRPGARKGRHLSAAAKQRISDSMKQTWADRKRAAKKEPRAA